MIDAIFIQSFHEEIKNFRLQAFIENLYKKLYNKNTKIVLFLNFQSIEIKDNLIIPPDLNIDIIYVEEDSVINPTTRIFQFLINYNAEKYRKILLLESDCALKQDFDKIINSELINLNNDKWFLYGSKYYGLMPWMSGKDADSKSRRDHINGVCVYNRSNDLLNLYNYIILSNNLEDSNTNYDFAIHQNLPQFNIEDRLIDSDIILNISDPNYDTKLTHNNIKPNAVIVHTKNPLYHKNHGSNTL